MRNKQVLLANHGPATPLLNFPGIGVWQVHFPYTYRETALYSKLSFCNTRLKCACFGRDCCPKSFVILAKCLNLLTKQSTSPLFQADTSRCGHSWLPVRPAWPRPAWWILHGLLLRQPGRLRGDCGRYDQRGAECCTKVCFFYADCHFDKRHIVNLVK